MTDPCAALSVGIFHPPDLPTGNFCICENDVGAAILIHIADDGLGGVVCKGWLKIRRRRCAGTDGNFLPFGAVAIHIAKPDIGPHHVEMAIAIEISESDASVYRITDASRRRPGLCGIVADAVPAHIAAIRHGDHLRLPIPVEISHGDVVDTRQIGIEDESLEGNGEVSTVSIPGPTGDDV